MSLRVCVTVVAALIVGRIAPAHDTWVETKTNVIRTGDAVHIDLKLGNHGNDHRDFKLAGKVPLEPCTLEVIAPDGSKYDLKDRLADVGYTPTEGYWTGRFAAGRPGLHVVAHTCDQVVRYAPVRSIKSAKTCFVVSDSLDRVPTENPGFDRVLGHPLELVPVANPVTPMGPGQTLKVKLLFNGKPLPETRVSFEVRAGEILGMAGLVGAGRTELAEAVFGVRHITGGELRLEGRPIRVSRPADAIAAGILLVPEDRRLHGLVVVLVGRHELRGLRHPPAHIGEALSHCSFRVARGLRRGG